MLSFKSNFPQGRFCNVLMQNIGLSIIGKKFNLKVNYDWSSKNNFEFNLDACLKNNFNFYNEGRVLTGETKLFSEFSEPYIEELVEKKYIDVPVMIEGFLEKECLLYKQKEILRSIIKKNKIKFYDQVFVHVRLGDMEKYSPGYSYYKNALKKIKFNSGMISTDSPKNKIIGKLIDNFNLSLNENENFQEVISLGSQYENRVITGGTSGWFIGYLGDNNNVYYVKNTYKKYNPFSKHIKYWPHELFEKSNWIGL